MSRPRFRWKRALAVVYAIALALSHAVRLADPWEAPIDQGVSTRWTNEVTRDTERARGVEVAFFEEGDPTRPTVVLIHGSPGTHREVRALAEQLAGRNHVLAIDLPGFGNSTRRIADYSIRAHAHYVWQLLDSLEIGEAHLLGFSMGGGVVLEMDRIASERTRSLILLSAIGAQEFELLGDYHLNHLIHGLQLGGLWLLREVVPHFGWWDGAFFSVEYARNFYDTDQRPLREILQAYTGPMLVLQGDKDPLVAPAAARETHRLVPQSDLLMLAGNHFMAFQRSSELAIPIHDFLERVEAGTATTRADASPDRLAAAEGPLDPSTVPPVTDLGFVVLLLLLAIATLVSEDLTCIGAGLLVARGTIGFLPATLACLVGITVGDLLLFLVGRTLGRQAVQRAPLRWFINEDDVMRSSVWFRQRGPWLVLASRFLPGTRLPTYLAAGILRTNFALFAAIFLLASALWTPLLVGLAAVSGSELLKSFESYEQWAAPTLALVAAGLFVILQILVPLATWRGRRLLLSRWRRVTRWEYWPRWAIYPPVVIYVLAQAIRHRSLTLFTCVNPAIPGGGFAGESKTEILKGLRAGGAECVAPFCLLPADPASRLQALDRFREAHGLGWPVVLKPDVGERGGGVAIVQSSAEALEYLARAEGSVQAQAYIPGLEYGVFWYRIPGEAHGHIFSITDKRFPWVTGDGHRTLEALILADDRAVGMARWFLRKHSARLPDIPAAGTVVPLVDLGTHSRGAAFFDGTALQTQALRETVDRMSRGYEGFWFGRYDVRTESVEALQRGCFHVIELNGASSEATSIYDPRTSLLKAWGILLQQWRTLFIIAQANRSAGAQPTGLRGLWRLIRHRWRENKAHVAGRSSSVRGDEPG